MCAHSARDDQAIRAPGAIQHGPAAGRRFSASKMPHLTERGFDPGDSTLRCDSAVFRLGGSTAQVGAPSDLTRTFLPGDVTARMLLAATAEAGSAVASAVKPKVERQRVGTLVMRLLEGLR